jgi:hypothetical protein
MSTAEPARRVCGGGPSRVDVDVVDVGGARRGDGRATTLTLV